MKKMTVLLAVLAAGGARSRAETPAVHALVGGRVVTVSGPVLAKGTIVLRDGLVAAVGENVPVPPDARVLDATGLTLTPGLIDGFGSLGLPTPSPRPREPGAAPPPPASPAPGPLVPEAMSLDQFRPAEAVKARDTGITTALVIRREGVLPGQSTLVNLVGEKVEDMVLRQPAALHLHLTSLSRQYPGSLMGTMAYARQALLDAGHYREEWTAYEKAPAGRKRPAYDKRLAAWQDVAAGRQALIVTASRENDIRRALALADEFKLRLVVAGAPRAWRLAELIKARKLPLLVTVNFDPARSAPEGFGGFGETDEEEQRKEIEDAKRNPGALEKAGVRFALVSGFAPDFLAGVRTAVASGLSKEGALRAITLGAAEALGIADRTGSLEVGKMANLVAWSGEPLTKEAKAKMVFVDGRMYEPEEKTETKREETRLGGLEERR
jgi:imidazolonepropionase-like amidohydrolase